jgi:hypothetical protein
MMDNKTKCLIAVPPALLIVLLIAAFSIPVEMTLSNIEQKILDFWSLDLSIEEQQVMQIRENLPSPITFERAAPKGSMKQNSKVATLDEFKSKDISLIVISDTRKMAMIRGVPVKEGDFIDDNKVERIEPDRVLIKNNTSRWVDIGR